ncbi:hypothetical protein BASA81_004010 [Batrachochytrium salamandrivorans]|nr:hypothetical protein BASA81_004010 [Batrachochytrium salamandrivorans]
MRRAVPGRVRNGSVSGRMALETRNVVASADEGDLQCVEVGLGLGQFGYEGISGPAGWRADGLGVGEDCTECLSVTMWIPLEFVDAGNGMQANASLGWSRLYSCVLEAQTNLPFTPELPRSTTNIAVC